MKTTRKITKKQAKKKFIADLKAVLKKHKAVLTAEKIGKIPYIQVELCGILGLNFERKEDQFSLGDFVCGSKLRPLF